MAKRLSLQIKKEILDLFTNGKYSIDQLSNKFECTKSTITRNLKKDLGNKKYQEIIALGNSIKNSREHNKNEICGGNQKKAPSFNTQESEFDFVELAPLDYEIENVPRKEFSSVHINDIELPNIVYMIVNQNIELEIKLLKDYPDWEFLPNEDLERKTIEIHFDLKSARTACSKDQKVIKVPNTNVFKIVSPILISRGISRIVSSEKLIAL